MESFTHIKSVAIFGAGPAGLTAVKYLKAENHFQKIVVFEQRDEVGGVWNYTPTGSEQDQWDLTTPRTRPSDTVDKPIAIPTDNDGTKFLFASPIYDALETNIPHTLMNYNDKSFPKDTPLFPHFSTVKRYLEEYADDIRDHIRFQSQIHEVKLVNGTREANTKWRVDYTDLASNTAIQENFDAVICATGHYSDPYIPEIQGLTEFQLKFPGIISHSKYYRNPAAYTNKKVVSVGNSASGVDISKQISTVASQVIVSEKEKPATLRSASTNIIFRPEIAEFLPQSKGIRFHDGHIETDVDYILFCTGYQYSFPFLKALDPPVVTSGERTVNTYQHIFYYPQPTLAFLTLPQRIVPFPVAEAQAAYVARVFSGRLALPTHTEMKTWEDGVFEKNGHKDFHNLKFPKDAEYINALYDISVGAKPLTSKETGKTPPYWDEEKRWIRQRFPMIKQAALELGEKRSEVRCLADLGFDFQAWREDQRLGQKTNP